MKFGPATFSIIQFDLVHSISAFTIIFTLMDPVPFEVKVMFHIFGGMGFILGLVLSIFTSMAVECVSSSDFEGQTSDYLMSAQCDNGPFP